MNSLTELNSYASQTITYTDNRTPRVLFKSPVITNQTVSIERKDTHTVPVGFEIKDITRADTAAVTYTVDVSAVSGATVAWGSLPSGVSVSNPSAGRYIVSGIQTVAHWNSIKSPTVSLPDAYYGNFTYTPTVSWYGGNTRSWTVSVTVSQIVFFGSAPNFYFSTNSVQLLTAPEILSTKSGTYTITITPSSTTAITTIAPAIADPSSICSFNNTSKVMTLTGTNSQVKTYLANLNVTYSTTASSDITFAYYGVCSNADLDDGSVTQNHYVTLYLSKARGVGSYTPTAIDVVGNTPLVDYHVSNAWNVNQTLTIVPAVTSNISSMFVTGWDYFNLATTYTVSPATNPGGSPSGEPNAVEQLFIDPTDQYLIVYSGDSDNTSPISYLYEYTKSGGDWVLNSTLTEDLEFYDNISMAYSSDASRLIVGETYDGVLQTGKVSIYDRSGGTLSRTHQLTGASIYDRFGDQVALSEDGNKLLVRNTLSSGTNVDNREIVYYTYTGGSWVEQQRISPGTTMAFAENFNLSADGTKLIVSAGNTETVYYYTLVAGQWDLTQTITSAGKYVKMNRLANTFIAINSSGDAKMYGYSTSWSLNNSWTGYGLTGHIQFKDDGTAWSASADNTTLAMFKLSNNAFVFSHKTLANGQGSDFSGRNHPYALNSDFTSLTARKPSTAANTFQTGTISSYTGSFDFATKQLTIVGPKAAINATLETLSTVATLTASGDITLSYTITTNTSATETRTQTLERT